MIAPWSRFGSKKDLAEVKRLNPPMPAPSPSLPAATKLSMEAPLISMPTEPLCSKPLRPEQLHVIVHPKQLGRGAYGTVQLGSVVHPSEGVEHTVAVKVISEDRMRPSSLAREVRILERLSRGGHPTAVHFHGWLKPGAKSVRTEDTTALAKLPESHCLVMDQLKGGELFEYVLKRKGLTELEAAPFMRQIVGGVHNAHCMGVAHRDIKLENVLFAGEAGPTGTLKIIDWGLAHQHMMLADGSVQRELVHSRCGSRAYMAPEVIAAKERETGRKGPGYDAFAADVWSLAVSLFAMLVGFFPFDQADPTKDWRARKCFEAQLQGESIVETIFGFYPSKQLSMSQGAKELIDSMLCFNAARRSTVEQVLRSSWLAPSDEPQQRLNEQRLSRALQDLGGAGTAPARIGGRRTRAPRPLMSDLKAALQESKPPNASPTTATDNTSSMPSSTLSPPASSLCATASSFASIDDQHPASVAPRASISLTKGLWRQNGTSGGGSSVSSAGSSVRRSVARLHGLVWPEEEALSRRSAA